MVFMTEPPIALERVNVTVLNADAGVLHRRTFRDLAKNLLNGKAWLVESHDPPLYIHTSSDLVEIPRVAMLRDYKFIKYNPKDYPTYDAIFERDNRMCQYFGCGAKGVTIDHVYPKSRGGGNTWWNLVAACQPCNGRKADRTPEEAGMRLIREPFRPKGI